MSEKSSTSYWTKPGWTQLGCPSSGRRIKSASSPHRKSPFLVLIMIHDQVITRDPEVVNYMYNTGFNSFSKGDRFRLRVFSFWGVGIFASDGERWRFVSSSVDDGGLDEI